VVPLRLGDCRESVDELNAWQESLELEGAGQLEVAVGLLDLPAREILEKARHVVR
jgi:hypothetical protein